MGQTTRDVKQRVAEQIKTAAIKNYRIELAESAERDDGTIFTNHDVRAAQPPFRGSHPFAADGLMGTERLPRLNFAPVW